MKHLLSGIFLTLFFVSCDNVETNESDSTHDGTENLSDETTGQDNNEDADPISTEIFLAYVEVDRFENPEEHKFELFSFNDLFYYQFPYQPEFSETQKSDHITYYTSAVVEGSQYIINVDDYSQSEEDVTIDAGFTKLSHDNFVHLYDSEIVHEQELTHVDGAVGYYTVYTYSKNDVEYTVDCAHFGFEDYVVALLVTGTPYGESYDVVTDYIGYFDLIKNT